MSFSKWFKLWILSFINLLTFDRKRQRSDRQKEKERLRRLKAKHSSANKYRTKKKYRRRRKGSAVQTEKLLSAMFKFMGVTLAVVLLPLGLFDWGRKSIKARSTSKRTNQHVPAVKHNSTSHISQPKTVETKKSTIKKTEATPKRHTNSSKPISSINEEKKTDTDRVTSSSYKISLFEERKPIAKPIEEKPLVTEPDENTPKSTPKSEKDQYIRKRMTIAGSSYCDADAFDCIKIGSYFELEFEPDNPYDKEAIRLVFNGKKIGYIAKADKLAFVTCLKLKRNIYGVITNIDNEKFPTKYEYETWFDLS